MIGLTIGALAISSILQLWTDGIPSPSEKVILDEFLSVEGIAKNEVGIEPRRFLQDDGTYTFSALFYIYNDIDEAICLPKRFFQNRDNLVTLIVQMFDEDGNPIPEKNTTSDLDWPEFDYVVVAGNGYIVNYEILDWYFDIPQDKSSITVRYRFPGFKCKVFDKGYPVSPSYRDHPFQKEVPVTSDYKDELIDFDSGMVEVKWPEED